MEILNVPQMFVKSKEARTLERNAIKSYSETKAMKDKTSPEIIQELKEEFRVRYEDAEPLAKINVEKLSKQLTSSSDWAKRADALDILVRYALGCESEKGFITDLGSLRDQFMGCVLDNRSSLAKVGYIAIVGIASKMKHRLDKYADWMIEPLFTKLANSSIVVSGGAEIAILGFVENVKGKCTRSVLERQAKSSSSRAKAVTAKAILISMKVWPQELWEPLQKVLSSLKKDQSSEVRSIANNVPMTERKSTVLRERNRIPGETPRLLKQGIASMTPAPERMKEPKSIERSAIPRKSVLPTRLRRESIIGRMSNIPESKKKLKSQDLRRESFGSMNSILLAQSLSSSIPPANIDEAIISNDEKGLCTLLQAGAPLTRDFTEVINAIKNSVLIIESVQALVNNYKDTVSSNLKTIIENLPDSYPDANSVLEILSNSFGDQLINSFIKLVPTKQGINWLAIQPYQLGSSVSTVYLAVKCGYYKEFENQISKYTQSIKNEDIYEYISLVNSFPEDVKKNFDVPVNPEAKEIQMVNDFIDFNTFDMAIFGHVLPMVRSKNHELVDAAERAIVNFANPELCDFLIDNYIENETVFRVIGKNIRTIEQFNRMIEHMKAFRPAHKLAFVRFAKDVMDTLGKECESYIYPLSTVESKMLSLL